jgi:hypothetical protein
MQDPTEKHISDVGILDKYNYKKKKEELSGTRTPIQGFKTCVPARI